MARKSKETHPVVAVLGVVIGVVGIYLLDQSGILDSNPGPHREAVSSKPAPTPTPTPAKQFTEADFYFDGTTRPHKETIIAGVNKVARENKACKTIDPGSAYISSSKGSASNPVFFVTCGSGASTHNVFFSKSDVESDVRLSQRPNIDRADALSACRDRAMSLAAHPSTVSFSAILDAAYTPHPNGRTTLTSTFTAENNFGNEIKHKIRCLFDGRSLIEANVSEI